MMNYCDHRKTNKLDNDHKIPNVQKITLLAFRRTEIWVVWRPYCLFPQCKAILELEGWWFQETGECHNLFQETGECHNLVPETEECHNLQVIFAKGKLLQDEHWHEGWDEKWNAIFHSQKRHKLGSRLGDQMTWFFNHINQIHVHNFTAPSVCDEHWKDG